MSLSLSLPVSVRRADQTIIQYSQYRPSERSQLEMRQKSRLHDPFFGLKTMDLRPTSVATEIVDTDWDGDEDEIISDIEDDSTNSPRVSLNSVCF